MLLGIIGAVVAVIIIIIIIVLIVQSGKDKKKEPDVSIMDVQNSGVPNSDENQEFSYGFEKEPTVVMPPVNENQANNQTQSAPVQNNTTEVNNNQSVTMPQLEPQKISPNEIKADSIASTDSLNAAVPQSEKVESESVKKENKTVSIIPNEEPQIKDIVNNTNTVNEEIKSVVAPNVTPEVNNVDPVVTPEPSAEAQAPIDQNSQIVTPEVNNVNPATPEAPVNQTSDITPAEGIKDNNQNNAN